MPATSGSPTQIATSAATPAELAGTPLDAFKEGDLGYVASLDKLFVLRRGTAPYAANNTTLIDGFGVDAYWADANEANFWAAVTAWWVDPVNGDDSASGTSLTEPIQTFGELADRIDGATDVITATVTVLSDSASTTDSPKFQNLPAGSSILVTGTFVTQIVATDITGVQVINRGANQYLQINATNMPATWTVEGAVGWLFRITSGPREGAFGFVMTDLGTANNTARVTRLTDPTTLAAVVPQVGDLFEVIQLTSIAAHPSVTGNENGSARVTFRYLQFADTTFDYALGKTLSGQTQMIGCRINEWLQMTGAGRTAFYGCAGTDAASIESYDAHVVEMFACGLGTDVSLLMFGAKTASYVKDDTLLTDGAILYSFLGGMLFTENLAVFDNTSDAVQVANGQYLGYNAIYGTGNTAQIINLGAWAHGGYSPNTAGFTATSTVPVLDFGGTTQGWANLPFVNSNDAAYPVVAGNQAGFIPLA